MKKILVYFAVASMAFLSCRSQKIDAQAVYGTFYKIEKGKYFGESYSLELHQNRSFKLIIKQQDASPQCQGQWEVVNNEILLKCQDKGNTYEMLTNSYMNEREHKVKILSKNRLAYKNVVLRRKDKNPALL